MTDIEAWTGCIGAPDDRPRANIAPGQELSVITPIGWRRMRWGLIPVGRVNARGRPVMETIVNVRSETLFDKSAFDGVGRAVVPIDGWYEWTGEKRKKTALRIAPKNGSPLAFAAITDIWRGPGGIEVPQVATVTCEPNDDLRPIHHRMGVILAPAQFDQWLNGSEAEASALCQPLACGELSIEEALGTNWDAP